MTVETAFEKLMGTYGRTAHGDGPAAARALCLEVHVEACHEVTPSHHGIFRGQDVACGKEDAEGTRYYCPAAERINALKEK